MPGCRDTWGDVDGERIVRGLAFVFAGGSFGGITSPRPAVLWGWIQRVFDGLWHEAAYPAVSFLLAIPALFMLAIPEPPWTPQYIVNSGSLTNIPRPCFPGRQLGVHLFQPNRLYVQRQTDVEESSSDDDRRVGHIVALFIIQANLVSAGKLVAGSLC